MAVLDGGSVARAFRTMLMSVLGIIAIYMEAAPLGLSPQAPPSPDLLLCVLAYFAVRRPGSCPILVVFLLGLVRDLLTDVPTGAGALSLVIGLEALKIWRRHLQRASFALEWLAVGAVAAGTAFTQWFVVLMSLAQPPYLLDLLHQCLYTTAAYGPVALVFRWLLRITWRRPEPA